MQNYTDKEILADGLCAQKEATGLFDKAANECVHPQVRKTMRSILEEEHDLQEDVFDMMHQKGFYPTPVAEDKKIQAAVQKFAQSME